MRKMQLQYVMHISNYAQFSMYKLVVKIGYSNNRTKKKHGPLSFTCREVGDGIGGSVKKHRRRGELKKSNTISNSGWDGTELLKKQTEGYKMKESNKISYKPFHCHCLYIWLKIRCLTTLIRKLTVPIKSSLLRFALTLNFRSLKLDKIDNI